MSITERIKWGVVMQVKDEADVIEVALLYWLALGATAVLVFDDHSMDGTFEKMRGIESRHNALLAFSSESEFYEMQLHINRLKGCFERSCVNWIIPADADEVWHFPNNDPAALFASLPQVPSWGEVPYYDNAPNGNRRLHTHRKCFGFLTPEMEICLGNHLILDGHKWPKIEDHGIYIEHYPVRNYEQMKCKLINHMQAYKDAHPDHEHARDWHRWKEMGEAFFVEKWNEFNF